MFAVIMSWAKILFLVRWMSTNIQNSVIYTISIHCVESVVVGPKGNNRHRQEKPLCDVEIMQKTLNVLSQDTDGIVCSSTNVLQVLLHFEKSKTKSVLVWKNKGEGQVSPREK